MIPLENLHSISSIYFHIISFMVFILTFQRTNTHDCRLKNSSIRQVSHGMPGAIQDTHLFLPKPLAFTGNEERSCIYFYYALIYAETRSCLRLFSRREAFDSWGENSIWFTLLFSLLDLTWSPHLFTPQVIKKDVSENQTQVKKHTRIIARQVWRLTFSKFRVNCFVRLVV